jgi:hypothetical protein
VNELHLIVTRSRDDVESARRDDRDDEAPGEFTSVVMACVLTSKRSMHFC